MNAMHQFSEPSSWAWTIMADHLWQSAIVVSVAALACTAASRSPARIRYRIWLIAAAKLAVPSIGLSIFLAATGAFRPAPSHIAAVDPERPSPVQNIPLAAPAFDSPANSPAASSAAGDWLFASLSVVWLAGFGLTLGNWLRQRRQYLRLIRGAVPACDPAILGALEHARAAAGVTSEVSLVVSDHAAEPGVWGVWKPVIVIPHRVLGELSPDELDAVLAHEMVHVQRRDNLAGNLTMVLYSLFWFFPAMWLVDRRLLLERERACDERVLDLGARPRTYVSAILKVSRTSLNQRMAGVSCASASSLKRRLSLIMSHNSIKTRTAFIRLVTALIAGVFITTMLITALGGRTRAFAQVACQRMAAALSSGPHRQAAGQTRGAPKTGVEAGIPGGVSGGVPGGVPDGVPGGVPGGAPDGVPGGVPEGVPGGVSGGVPGGVSAGVPGGVAGYDASQQPRQDGNPAADEAAGFQGTIRLQITQVTPDLPIAIQPSQDAPVSLEGAWIKTLRFDQVSPSPSTPDEGVWYRVRLSVRLLNKSNRVVTGVAVRISGLNKFGPSRVVNLFDAISKDSYFTLHRLLGEGQVSSEDTFGVKVRLVGIRFDDGTAWGSSPPGPRNAALTPSSELRPSSPAAVQPGPTPLPPHSPAPSSVTPEPAPSTSPSAGPPIVRKSGGLLQGGTVNRVQPVYPEDAKAAGISGRVAVEVVIDEEGKVEKATAVSGPEALREAAEQAARQWRWNPTTLSGVPVRVAGTIEFAFVL